MRGMQILPLIRTTLSQFKITLSNLSIYLRVLGQMRIHMQEIYLSPKIHRLFEWEVFAV